MKITFIGHASILVEAGGVTVLSDPWWRGPCFGAQWWTYPLPHVAALEDRKLDYIYISHGHHDHFHPGTLNGLDKKTRVLVAAGLDLAAPIEALGFQVTELVDGVELRLGAGDLICRIMRTHGDDTLMALDDGKEVCLNLNDALHSTPPAVQKAFIKRLNALYPKIDYVFCGYGVASHFPNCYAIPGKDREASAAKRQQHFNRRWAEIVAGLRPRHAFPFAADVVFLEEELFWANEVTHNSERPTELFRSLYPKSPVKALDIAPGFEIEAGEVRVAVLRQPVVAAQLRTECAEQILRARRHGSIDSGEVYEVAALLRANLQACADYLRTYAGNYRMLIRFHHSDLGIRLKKRGRKFDLSVRHIADCRNCDLAYTTRLPYMKWALTQPYGHEILFVGSGGMFEYLKPESVKDNPHRELIQLIRKRKGPARAPAALHRKAVAALKRAFKRLAGGGSELDLYDLHTWTVYARDPRPAQEKTFAAQPQALQINS